MPLYDFQVRYQHDASNSTDNPNAYFSMEINTQILNSIGFNSMAFQPIWRYQGPLIELNSCARPPSEFSCAFGLVQTGSVRQKGKLFLGLNLKRIKFCPQFFPEQQLLQRSSWVQISGERKSFSEPQNNLRSNRLSQQFKIQRELWNGIMHVKNFRPQIKVLWQGFVVWKETRANKLCHFLWC